MSGQIDELFDTFSRMSQEAVRRKLEAWDADQGRAILFSRKPPCKYVGSPALQNAGVLRSYWRMPYYDVLH